MKIEYIKTDELKPYEKNAKKHPIDQIAHIANSIKEFGFRQPVVIDRDNVIVIGHGRVLAAKKLGLDEVPVVRADDLSPEQIKALRLADNKTNESEWDFDLLGIELDNICDIDMSRFGFEIEPETPEVIEDDVPDMESTEARCNIGDVWQLGEHRLICGDSTEPETFQNVIRGVLLRW